MKILVTGGAGFIGSHMVDSLINLGHQVIVVDNLYSGKRENVNSKANFYHIDITHLAELERIFEEERPQIVFHLAAHASVSSSIKKPSFDANINILGTINVLECCIKYGVKKIIYSGSCAVYGNPNEIPIKETHPLQPISPYGLSKLVIEKYIQLYHLMYNLDYTIFRYANVYGPRQDSSNEGGVIAIFINKILNNEPILVFGDGNQIRDWIYVKDIVDANIGAIQNNHNDIFNVGQGIGKTLNELILELKKINSKEFRVVYEKERKGEIKKSVLDSSKLFNGGFSLAYNLEKGIKETWDYFLKQKNCKSIF